MTTAKKKFLFIHMGGTIGMKMTEKGLAHPETADEYRAVIKSRIKQSSDKHDFSFVSLSTVDSNNINAERLEELVAYIRAYEDQYDAIIITHGTDTLASTAAALNAAFHDGTNSVLSTPIVITAAQSSIHEEPSDASQNLLHTVYAADALSDGKYYPIVAVVFRDYIINGAHVIKQKESGFDAFGFVSEEGFLGRTDAVGKFKLKWNKNLPEDKALTPGQRQQKLAGMHGRALPQGRLLISPLDFTGNPIEKGCYVHLADVGTFGSSRSFSLQGADPGCLAILFKLTGIGNTGEKKLYARERAN